MVLNHGTLFGGIFFKENPSYLILRPIPQTSTNHKNQQKKFNFTRQNFIIKEDALLR